MRTTTVGIISIGEMGLGIAKLLQDHNYRIVTVAAGRSEHTLARIHAAGIEALDSDDDLVIQSDYILSIVPPRDALATATRIATACQAPETARQRATLEDANQQPCRSPLVYLELNATSARLAKELGALFSGMSEEGPGTTMTTSSATSTGAEAVCWFLDGGIIGPPPALQTPEGQQSGVWKKPSVVVSGPAVARLPATFPRLATALNVRVVSAEVGAASTLKMSFAALTKGLTALSILSVSTAQRAQLLPELLAHLDEYSPATGALARGGVVAMSPKAYRWVDEMRGIGQTFEEEGGWEGVGASIYDGFAEIYRVVAEDTVLGGERAGARVRGTSVGDAAEVIASRGTRKAE
ncbi:hypothetical protein N7462_010145 [Penicillium macrosclerotiorum]|uniref:uncharacterized protein n=1 Tax=Penicillium macrosclerotiorum TaxID=303699 RepID=UPI0025479AB6|nr:uncharacterized protein N7462_010145 [Penicillium macrosclerotiorum]KAJ5669075.1 hypothetical protein N7462_010145 [Penicillium macrosclerotiorum]